MSKDRIDIQTIAEILISELDKLEGAAKRIEAVLPAVDLRLKKLQETTIPVETAAVENLLRRLEEVSVPRSVIPQWIVVIAIVGVIMTFMGFNIAWQTHQSSEGIKVRKEAFEQYIVVTGQADAFNEWYDKQ